MKRLNIALLAGGNSSEREIALQSAAQIEASLDRTKYDVTLIDLHGRSWCYTSPDGRRWEVDKNDFSITVGGLHKPFDYALVLIHGTPGEDGRLQGYLEMMGIPHSSCSMTSSVLTFDKVTTKRTVAAYGIPLAKGIFVRNDETVDTAAVVRELGLPLFVKPNASGSSFGVTKVKEEGGLPAAIEAAFAESDGILIEECLVGRELACGIFGDEVFPITEIVPAREFFDFEAKYTAGAADEITPAPIPAALAEELARLTRLAYRTCRCRGLARVDFIVTEAGSPYMIEINSIPGMSAGSIVPKQVAHMGSTLGELYDRIIEATRR